MTVSTEPAVSWDVTPNGPVGRYSSDCISCYVGMRGQSGELVIGGSASHAAPSVFCQFQKHPQCLKL
jgi:hypothetical protein